MPTPEALIAVQNVGLGIASFVFLGFIVFYILKRDDERHKTQLLREDKREERDDKRLDAWQALVQTQSTQIATLIQQIGSQSTQIANVTATAIEMLQIIGRIETLEKQNAVALVQINSFLANKPRPDTGDLSRLMDEGKR